MPLLHVLIGLIAVQVAVGAAALLALALWQLAEAAWGGAGGIGADRAKHRAKAAGKGVVYLALAYTTSTFARGGSSSSSGQSSDVTADLMAGTGVRKKFLQDLRSTGGGHVGRAVVRLGQLGYVAKGVVVGLGFVAYGLYSFVRARHARM